MNTLWPCIILLSVVSSIFFGKTTDVSTALIESGNDAITLILSLCGAMAVWSGLMRIADKSGITDLIAKFFSPVIRLLMPDIPKNSEAEKYITMNISANLLGLGNAATPLGLNAMNEMHRLAGNPKTATRSMAAFVVLNTASIQLIPSTIAVLRTEYGSSSPLDILPCVWIVSIAALSAGLIVYFILSSGGKKQ